MKQVLLLLTSLVTAVRALGRRIRDCKVLPHQDGLTQAANLPIAIGWASAQGAALLVDPSDVPYMIACGFIQQKNVSLTGVGGTKPDYALAVKLAI